MEETTELTPQIISNDSLALITKAEIDVQISTARAFPRSLKIFRDKAMSMATFSEDIASSCSYSLPRGGKSLDGPSVRLAEIVCASYGNIRSGARVISIDDKTVTAQGICHDLETNNCVTVEVKRRITGKDGKRFNDDLITVTGNAACAIAYRNAVFKVVPAAMIQEVYEKAKEVARGTAETLVKRRDKALDYFRGIGVKDKQICEVLDIKKVEDIDLDKLSVLTGMRAAIKNGEATVKSLFEVAVEKVDEAEDRIMKMINAAATVEDLKKLEEHLPNSLFDLYNDKMNKLTEGKLFEDQKRKKP